jgi:hypothetical protein
MKLTKRFWKIVLCAFIGIALTGGIIYMAFPFTNPSLLTGAISLSRPESAIRRDMLRTTPLGTSKEDVIKVIKEREWTVRYIRDTNGYFMSRRFLGDGPQSSKCVEIGTQSIRIFLGKFNAIGIIGVPVDVYYAFDEDSKLIDVAIRREMDLP